MPSITAHVSPLGFLRNATDGAWQAVMAKQRLVISAVKPNRM